MLKYPTNLVRIIALLIIANNAAFAAQAEFQPARNYRTDSDPIAVVVADFNRDGVPDVAALDQTNNVSILLGTGGGIFGSAKNYPIGTDNGIALFAGDFNNDGNVDVLIGCEIDDFVAVILFGNGDGTLQSPVNSEMLVTVNKVALGDFNQDGQPDLALTIGSDGFPGYVGIALGKGDGTFEFPQELYPAGISVFYIASGDLNGDSAPDLVIDNNLSETVGVLLNNGDGSFQPVIHYPLNSVPSTFVIGDTNNDGIPDLAVNVTGSTVLALGKGDGSFQSPNTVLSNGLAGVSSIADFNNDGLQDFADGGTVNTYAVVLGNGDGTFVAPASYLTGSNPSMAAVADLNGDGYLDLVVPTEQRGGAISVLLNVGASISVTLSPTTLTFLAQTIGTTSAPQTVKLTNTSASDLTISSVAVSGDFLVKNKCSSNVAPSASCNITIQFRPRAAGSRKGVLAITDSAPSSPQKIQLTGIGQ